MYNLFDHYLMGERVYTDLLTPVCEKYNLTYMELTVLMFLANNPTLDTASDIVRCRKLTKSHVSVSVHSLENQNFLTRNFQNGNRRSVHLKLCSKAFNVIDDGKVAQRNFVNLMFNGISAEEKENFTKILMRMDKNIKSYFPNDKKVSL